jgi:hypothetical protein
LQYLFINMHVRHKRRGPSMITHTSTLHADNPMCFNGLDGECTGRTFHSWIEDSDMNGTAMLHIMEQGYGGLPPTKNQITKDQQGREYISVDASNLGASILRRSLPEAEAIKAWDMLVEYQKKPYFSMLTHSTMGQIYLSTHSTDLIEFRPTQPPGRHEDRLIIQTTDAMRFAREILISEALRNCTALPAVSQWEEIQNAVNIKMDAIQHAMTTARIALMKATRSAFLDGSPDADQAIRHYQAEAHLSSMDNIRMQAMRATAQHLHLPDTVVTQLLQTNLRDLEDRSRDAPQQSHDPALPPAFHAYTEHTARVSFTEKHTPWCKPISFLVNIDATQVKTGEDPQCHTNHHPECHEIYRQWTIDGFTPPPVQVFVEQSTGNHTSPDHQRIRIAQEFGLTIDAWLYPSHPQTGTPLCYGDVMEAYAHELGKLCDLPSMTPQMEITPDGWPGVAPTDQLFLLAAKIYDAKSDAAKALQTLQDVAIHHRARQVDTLAFGIAQDSINRMTNAILSIESGVATQTLPEQILYVRGVHAMAALRAADHGKLDSDMTTILIDRSHADYGAVLSSKNTNSSLTNAPCAYDVTVFPPDLCRRLSRQAAIGSNPALRNLLESTMDDDTPRDMGGFQNAIQNLDDPIKLWAYIPIHWRTPQQTNVYEQAQDLLEDGEEIVSPALVDM